jgi:hypothetical protein
MHDQLPLRLPGNYRHTARTGVDFDQLPVGIFYYSIKTILTYDDTMGSRTDTPENRPQQNPPLHSSPNRASSRRFPAGCDGIAPGYAHFHPGS